MDGPSAGSMHPCSSLLLKILDSCRGLIFPVYHSSYSSIRKDKMLCSRIMNTEPLNGKQTACVIMNSEWKIHGDVQILQKEMLF